MFRFVLVIRKKFTRSCTAATSIEYGLIASGISIVIATIVYTIGDDVFALFETVANALLGD